MAITCSIGGVDLDDNAVVLTEYVYRTAQHKHSRTVTGAFVVESFDKTSHGEIITLSNMWLTRSTLNSLSTLANDSDGVYTLTLPDSSTVSVMFNCARGTVPIKATELLPNSNRASSDKFDVTLSFIKVG